MARGDAYLLGYPFEPGALRLEAGVRFASLEPPAGLPLPAPLAAFRLTAAGWAPVPPDEAPWSRFRRPAITVEGCLERGGCVAEGEPLRCQVPCAPEPVRAPDLPRRDCPAGWAASATAEPEVRMCAPTWPDRVACDAYAWQPFEAAACRPLAGCPAGPWPEVPDGPTIYVEAGRSGGGGRDDPMGTLTQAVELAAPGATIVVGTGEYRGVVDVQKEGLRFIGRCPEASRIVVDDGPAVRVMGVVARFEGLHIESAAGPAAALSLTSSVTFARSRLVADPAVETSVLVGGGFVALDTVRLEGRTGVSLRQGYLQARDIDVSAQMGLLCAEGASMDVDGATVRQDDTEPGNSALALNGCGEVALRRAYLRGVNRHVVLGSSYARLLLEDVQVVATPGGMDAVRLTPSDAFDTPRARTTFRRLAVRGGRHGVYLSVEHLLAEDVLVEGARESAVRLNGAIHGNAPGAELYGLWVRRSRETAFEVLRSDEFPLGYPVRVEDLVVADMVDNVGRNAMLRAKEAQRLTVDRAWLELPGGIGVESGCAEAFEVESLTLRGRGTIGIDLEPEQTARLQRVDVQADLTIGLSATPGDSCGAGRADISDVRLRGPGAGQGLSMLGGGALRARRLDVRDYATGIEIAGIVGLDIVDARVTGNIEGVSAPGDFALAPVFRRVALDNTRDVVRR